MTLTLYSTLTRKKEIFEPEKGKKVRVYVCGPTVYDFAHIGNARPVIVFDVLFRVLQHVYGKEQVVYARNITDVDDKIIAAARETGETIEQVTRRTSEAFHVDMAALGSLEPTIEPRATQHISQMITMIERLIEKGHAYAADGHVLFDVVSWNDYGELSRRDREEMIAGARVEVAPYKKDPADFVLWKPSSDEQPGWESPWGRGRPGWHIECSAMSAEHLGETFDIHGGGLDLVFPHHENEIAQSRSVHGSRHMARIWMHNGYVVVDGQKMSKSLGNFITVRQLLEEGFRGEAIRLTLLSGHYRQPLDVTREKIGAAKAQLDRMYGALRSVAGIDPAPNPDLSQILEALEDDLNTPQALAVLHRYADLLNDSDASQAHASAKAQLIAGGYLLGLLQSDPEAWFRGSADDAEAAEIEALIEARTKARKSKNFAEADRIRGALEGRGVLLEDGPGGTIWRRKD